MQNHNRRLKDNFIEEETLFNPHGLGTLNVSGLKRCALAAGFDRERGITSDDDSELMLQNSNVNIHHSVPDNIQPQQRCNSVDQTQMKNALPNGKKTKGRVKIKMEFIDNKLRRYTTFSKRKTGIMKKAYELSTLTGTQVMLLVASETGHVYTFATRKLQPMITSEAGKALIQTCLNSPDPPSLAHQQDQRMSATGYEEPELSYAVTDDDRKSPALPDEYLNGSSSCSGSESSMPGSPVSPVPISSSSSSISPLAANSVFSSSNYTGVPVHLPTGILFSPTTEGGSVIIGNTSNDIYGGNSKGVIYSSHGTGPEANSSLLLKVPSALQHIAESEDVEGRSQLSSLPMEFSSTFSDAAIAMSSSFSNSQANTSQSLPTDLSLPIKRETGM